MLRRIEDDEVEFRIGYWDASDDREKAIEDATVSLARGDFVLWRSKLKVWLWLRRTRRLHRAMQGRTALGAAVRQADAAERAAIAAYIAIGVSLVSLGLSVVALYR